MMPRKKAKSKNDSAMIMVHPNAAAIDVGATLLMAAVRADRTSEPVRSFGTFTTDLHRLADWLGCDRIRARRSTQEDTTERTIRCLAERRRTTGNPPSRSASQMPPRTTVKRGGREKAGLVFGN